jgi:hypothetical protein
VYFAVALPLICLCFLYEVWPMINSRTRRFWSHT